MGPPRTWIQVHDGEAEATPDLRTGVLTWKRITLTLSMAVLTAASGIIGSHWGGVTKDELAKAKEETIARVTTAVTLAVSAESDAMKKYVDAKVESGRQPTVRAARRKQPSPRSDEQ